MFFCLSNIFVPFLLRGGRGLYLQVYCKFNNIVTTTTATTGNSYFLQTNCYPKLYMYHLISLYIQFYRKYDKNMKPWKLGQRVG